MDRRPNAQVFTNLSPATHSSIDFCRTIAKMRIKNNHNTAQSGRTIHTNLHLQDHDQRSFHDVSSFPLPIFWIHFGRKSLILIVLTLFLNHFADVIGCADIHNSDNERRQMHQRPLESQGLSSNTFNGLYRFRRFQPLPGESFENERQRRLYFVSQWLRRNRGTRKLRTSNDYSDPDSLAGNGDGNIVLVDTDPGSEIATEDDENLRKDTVQLVLQNLHSAMKKDPVRLCGLKLTNRTKEICKDCAPANMRPLFLVEKKSGETESSQFEQLTEVCCVRKCTDSMIRDICCKQESTTNKSKV